MPIRFLTTCALLAAAATAGAQSAERYFVRLQSPAVATWSAEQKARRGAWPARAAQRAHTRNVRAEQDRMSAELAPLVTRELGRLSIAVNGLKVLATPQQVQALRKADGVRSVARIAHHSVDNATSVAWVGAPQVWETFGDGEGMVIAVIDTGIDYLHANFGGAGDPAEYAANDKNVIEPGTFPTAKVIGGWDFAGPTYNSRVDEFPMPDPDPLDGNGHGSHVSGTAAGIGVDRRIGPGVAKGASLLALKVFSDESGSTDLTADAIDMALDPNGDGAIDDRVDVINMSLGARFGDQNDPSALASTAAVQTGVIVVASAGNNGDNPYVTGSPGVSPDVITVGATIAGDRPQIALRVLSDDPALAGLYPAQQGSGPVRIVDAPVTAPLTISRAPAIDDDGLVIPGEFDDRACRSLSNFEQVRGTVVLVARGGCSYEAKYAAVQEAGGLAVLAFNDGPSNLPFIMGGVGASGKELTIPGLMISGTDAQRLLDALGNVAFELEFNSDNTVDGPSDRDDQLTFFTSRGPASGGAQFKPDLSAPGRFIVSTAAGTGFESRQLRGTSMAAPHVAGAAALLRQHYPDLPVPAIKALLQNSTVTSELDGVGTNTPAPLTRQGLGVMRIPDALALSSYAAPAGVSFGYTLLATDEQTVRSTTLYNMTDTPRTFTVQHVPRATRAGMAITCPDTVSVAPGGQTDFEIALTATASALTADMGRLDHAEIDGWCVLSDGLDTLRVGYIAARDPAAAVAVDTDNAAMTLTNTGVASARASGFRTLASGGTLAATRTIGAVGFRRNDIFGLPVFQLAVALNEGWETPAHVSVEMLIDAEQDGLYERMLWAGDWSLLRFDPGTYVTAVFKVDDELRPITTSGYTDWFTEEIDFNDQVMVLPYSLLPEFGLSFLKPDQSQFDFKLRVVSRDGSYDETQGTVDLNDVPAAQPIDVTLNPGQSRVIERTDDGPWLWLTPANPIGTQFTELPPLSRSAVDSAHEPGRPRAPRRSLTQTRHELRHEE